MAREERRAAVPSEQISLLRQQNLDRTKQRVSSHCKPTYRMRKLINKRALYVIICNLLLATVPYYIKNYVPRGITIGPATWGFIISFAGWFADVYFGRYKVIRWSMWIMWVGCMLATLNSVVAQSVSNYYRMNEVITVVSAVIMAIGFGGYQANVIQFGLDQLQGASTTEITAFISWYYWTYFSSRVVMDLSHTCMKKEYQPLGGLIVCICITAAIISSVIFQRFLINEPVTQNPLKLLYKIIQYTIKNKHPRCRSAFTYCEDELPSRIDFGKSKYGGPFTTEQVEDVKTFLRLLVITVVASILIGEIVVLSHPSSHLINILTQVQSLKPFTGECYRESFLIITLEYIAITVYIPLHEFILYPTLQKYIPSIKMHQKFILGMVLQIARVITLMVFDVTARKTYYTSHNSTIQCLLIQTDVKIYGLTTSFNSRWIILPTLLQSVSLTLLSISGMEFFVSQTPYSMRGLMLGAGYGFMLLFSLTGYAIYWPFTQQSPTWSTGIISCEFWYLLSVILVLIITSGVLLAAGRWYKNRKRQDVLPNEHIFAERYFSQVN